jgi:CDGSH-type Zn-finger protein
LHHSRFCVTGAPTVFLANVKGGLVPDAIERWSRLHACPSGAIRYVRRRRSQEIAPPESDAAGGTYALAATCVRWSANGYRATLCRCGASKNKPFCDGSHQAVGFAATGEPQTRSSEMLAIRDGPLAIDPQPDGPLRVRGNLEIVSGTGRVIARITNAKLCRCGASGSKPFCDGSHARVGFKST